MGRYYSGDIEGKFWFAIQSSDAADRFGASGHNDYLNYYFDTSHLPDIKSEIKDIENDLGPDLKLIEKFFKNTGSYNNDMLLKFFKEEGRMKKSKEIETILSDFADLTLGKKILKCVQENGECSFQAEI